MTKIHIVFFAGAFEKACSSCEKAEKYIDMQLIKHNKIAKELNEPVYFTAEDYKIYEDTIE